jgi:hypothetical protein
MLPKCSSVIATGCAALVLAGCGGGSLGTPTDVTGKVTQNGQPLADVQVTFHALEGLPAEHRTRTAQTDSEGLYKLTEVYPAEYQVTIAKPVDYSDVDPAEVAAEMPANDPLAKYGDESPLRANVSPDKSTFDFQLEGP